MNDLGFPCDHCAVITAFRFRDERVLHRRAHQRKPIGWVPHGTGDDYRKATADFFQDKFIMPLQNIAKGIQEAARLTGAPRAKRPPAGTSDTEQRLRRILASAGASEAERRAAVDELWRCRHLIQIEKSTTMNAHTLEHLRGGGWGAGL